MTNSQRPVLRSMRAGWRNVCASLIAGVLLLTGLADGRAVAQEDPSPRQCFQAFIDAVLDSSGAADAARQAALAKCFDFDAWAEEKQRLEGAKFSAEERRLLQSDWLTLLASDEFRDNFSRKGVRIIEQELGAQGAATVIIALGEATQDKREERIRMRMRLDAKARFWRWYWSDAVNAMPSSLPQPRTAADLLRSVTARLEEIAKLQVELVAERESLLRRQRELQARLEEERGQGPRGSPQSLARAAGRALLAGDWEGFAALHDPACTGEGARERFDALQSRLSGWEVKDTSVREAGGSAIASIEVSFRDRTARVIALRLRRAGDQWQIDEAP